MNLLNENYENYNKLIDTADDVLVNNKVNVSLPIGIALTEKLMNSWSNRGGVLEYYNKSSIEEGAPVYTRGAANDGEINSGYWRVAI